ncbi:membrane protein insertion efficiency factor YidD [Candidatus Uhrbacteria bacterium RIFCSPLOWO2_02_FULL_48_12]|uniref:Putative membrane protein insertion efficiency factor n=1 Tax=Candidatus Uhrbacteria bacterium RIFCSPLOWO2_02_FULL_48_12 TaxID=1802407 RepID=A0A1F7V7J1_9BACT|nr:MAG: membrane protein insertion efficiency factor YidD [Candidatus Uhrbacteria bacterium RIFCSPLOWO2_02_FULL_48_12]
MRYLIFTLIKIYQSTLSPDHGIGRIFFPRGCCRFYPTCSEYALEAVKKYGSYGLWLAARRLFRCHPWSIGGVDEVV